MNGLKLGSIMLASLGFLLLNSPVSAQNNLRAELESFQEVPAVSSPASGQFRAKVIKNTSIEYTLSYKGLEADATQSHIHIGQPSVNGGIVVFLCQADSKSDPTKLAPECPAREGSVTGTLTSANLAPNAQAQGQGIEGDYGICRVAEGDSRRCSLRQRSYNEVRGRRDSRPNQIGVPSHPSQ